MFPHATFLQLRNIDHSIRVLKTINNIYCLGLWLFKGKFGSRKKFQNCTNLLLNKGICLRPPIKKETVKRILRHRLFFNPAKWLKTYETGYPKRIFKTRKRGLFYMPAFFSSKK